MGKKFIRILLSILVLVLIVFAVLYIIDHSKMKSGEEVVFSTWGKKYAPKEKLVPEENDNNINEGLNIVLSLEDKIVKNSAWCGTFNLIWNDLKNDIAKQDIVFSPQPEVVENLNKGTFSINDISEDAYYKVYGHPSLELKEEIEKAIKEKFNEKSDILDDFDWKNVGPNDYFLYAMLKKKFEFNKEFTEFEDGIFKNVESIKCFGINEKTDDSVRKQVEVLYYNSKDDFAVKLLTKSDDEVIISKGIKQESFGDVYDEILENSENYDGDSKFNDIDSLKIPNIKFKLKESFEELENKKFYFSNGDEYIISKAIQTIEFELDKKGGKIKSEAGMMVNDVTAIIPKEEKREFLVDDTFTIFLKENDKDLPYFAAQIDDIATVQDI